MPNTLTHYLRHPGQFPWSFALWLAKRRLRHALGTLLPTSSTSPPDLPTRAFRREYAHLAKDHPDLAEHFRTRQEPQFFAGVETTLAEPPHPLPFEQAWIGRTVAQADRAREHVFQYARLGPIDLGSHIDWQKEPVSLCLSEEDGTSSDNALHEQGQGDLRVTWELNRCHQFVTLGLAYRYTGDEAYVEEVVAQMRSWIRANPTGQGVNWTSAMEAAIRIINWIWAFYLCRCSPHMTDDAVYEFLSQVRTHGNYIHQNLERSAVSNNHYLANGVGLLHLGILFPEFKESTRWLRTGRKIVFSEVLHQVSRDGVDFEGSISYQGFVLSLLIPTIVLCLRNGVSVPNEVLGRLERMFEFVQAYTKPDGTFPQLGDSDDGRLLPLAPRCRDTHRPLLTLGAVLFGREDFKAASCGWGPEAHWLLGKPGFQRYQQIRVAPGCSTQSQGFLQGGIFCLRHDDLHMVIDCADVGARGRGGHGHNDCLSFELFALGRTFITDSGTFRYAGPEEERNLFRSTAAHNTAMVDGQEMGKFVPEVQWRISNDAKPTLHLWHTDDWVDVFDGAHSGYQRLPHPVRHRRRVIFDKRDRFWVLEDHFLGTGDHRFDLFFHFAPMIVTLSTGSQLVATAQDASGASLALIPLSPAALQVETRPGWVSSRYGAREEASVACYSYQGPAPATIRLCLYPSSAGERYEVEHVRRLAWEQVEHWATRVPIAETCVAG